MILGHFVGGPDHFESDQFVPPFFEAGDNVAFYRGNCYCFVCSIHLSIL